MLRHATLRARLLAGSPMRTAYRHRQTLAAMGDTAREAHESLRRMSRFHDSFSNGRLMHICKLCVAGLHARRRAAARRMSAGADAATSSGRGRTRTPPPCAL